MQEIEVGGYTKHPIGKKLSHFHARPFIFDDVFCGGFEGIIQALKCPDPERQKEICALSGKAAWQAGQAYNGWKEDQILYWKGRPIERISGEYLRFITSIYDALYEYNNDLRKDLLKLGNVTLWHSIGKADKRETVLTEEEMLLQLYRLQIRAVFERMSRMIEPPTSK